MRVPAARAGLQGEGIASPHASGDGGASMKVEITYCTS
jgi:hypothetical protein